MSVWHSLNTFCYREKIIIIIEFYKRAKTLFAVSLCLLRCWIQRERVVCEWMSVSLCCSDVLAVAVVVICSFRCEFGIRFVLIWKVKFVEWGSYSFVRFFLGGRALTSSSFLFLFISISISSYFVFIFAVLLLLRFVVTSFFVFHFILFCFGCAVYFAQMICSRIAILVNATHSLAMAQYKLCHLYYFT